MKISICIPTYNRPEFLKKAILSCFFESNYQFEILIGDDSSSPSLNNIEGLNSPKNYEIKYYHHSSPLKQNKNVDFLIQKTTGEYCIIMHDDDNFIPDGINHLLTSLRKLNFPEDVIIYGKQIVINNQGRKIEEATKSLNQNYQRTKHFKGFQSNQVEAVLFQRCPSNGFLIPGKYFRLLGYRDFETVGDACDFDLIARAITLYQLKLYFIGEYVTNYRLSDQSVTRLSNYNAIVNKYKILDEYNISSNNCKEFRKMLNNEYGVLMGYYFKNHKNREALNLYFSRNYPFLKRFSPRGIYHLIKLTTSIIFK